MFHGSISAQIKPRASFRLDPLILCVREETFSLYFDFAKMPTDVEKELVAEAAIAEKSSSDDESSSREWTELDEKRIRRKIDWRLIPTVFLLYLMCFIDRANIG